MIHIHTFKSGDKSLIYTVINGCKEKKTAEDALIRKLNREDGVDIQRGVMEILQHSRIGIAGSVAGKRSRISCIIRE